MANWLLGIVLGVVQGISEWLPISSKTQIIIASNYLYGLNFMDAYALGLFLEVGTFFAALVYFRKEVWTVLKALVGRGDPEGRLLLKFLLVTTVITGVVGVVIYKVVSESVSGPVLGVPMIALGCILIVDGLFIRYARKETKPRKELKDLTLRDMVIIGLAQGVAALPGVSRSGATVSTMLIIGVRPRDSFKLSFLALIPASIGATIVTILFTDVSLSSTATIITYPVIVIAIMVTVLVGLVFIRVLLRAAGSSKIALLTFSLGVLAIIGGVLGLLFGTG